MAPAVGPAPARGSRGTLRATPAPSDHLAVDDLGLEEIVATKLRGFLRRLDGYPVKGLHHDVVALVERPLLGLVLEHTGGNQLRAAEILGLNRNTLRKKLVELGLAAPGRPRRGRS